jgi:hypothetical protein
MATRRILVSRGNRRGPGDAAGPEVVESAKGTMVGAIHPGEEPVEEGEGWGVDSG